MTDAELDALEAAAKAATPGPWEEVKGNWSFDILTRKATSKITALYDCSDLSVPRAEEMTQKNAAFIAAANPATVLELIAALRQAKAERDWLANTFTAHCNAESTPWGPVCFSCQHGNCQYVTAEYWLQAAKEATCQK